MPPAARLKRARPGCIGVDAVEFRYLIDVQAKSQAV
jgi:hypothetical protein